jgi:hypothetical protein
MNSAAVKAAVFMGLLPPALYAQDLEKGGFEVRAFGGIINAGNGPTRVVSPAVGIEGAFGISRFVALTAGYTHDYLHDSALVTCDPPAFILPGQTTIPKNCVSYEFQQEFMGGVRVSAPNRSRLTPHLQFSLGAVRQTSTSSPASFASGKTEFGLGPGAGVDCKITRHFGTSIDVNFVKANRLTGFYHVTGGVFFRF